MALVELMLQAPREHEHWRWLGISGVVLSVHGQHGFSACCSLGQFDSVGQITGINIITYIGGGGVYQLDSTMMDFGLVIAKYVV